MKVSNQIVDVVEATIERYRLLRRGQSVGVALSGGKDSITLTLALRELEYEVIGLVVDMGYETGWSARIERIAKDLSFDVRVLNSRKMASSTGVELKRKSDLVENMKAVVHLEGDTNPSGLTPCTSCYNTKVILLEEAAVKAGIDTVAFGHHLTDASASMLKSAVMYLDRWHMGRQMYSSASFRSVVGLMLTEASQDPSLETGLWGDLPCLIESGQVATDEPPRQLLLQGSKVQLVRPMFNIWEHDVVACSERNRLEPEPSGCGHSAIAEHYTPREIVQHELLAHLEPSALFRIGSLAARTVDEDGRLRYEARKHRSEILGSEYKPSYGSLPKL